MGLGEEAGLENRLALLLGGGEGGVKSVFRLWEWYVNGCKWV